VRRSRGASYWCMIAGFGVCNQQFTPPVAVTTQAMILLVDCAEVCFAASVRGHSQSRRCTATAYVYCPAGVRDFSISRSGVQWGMRCPVPCCILASICTHNHYGILLIGASSPTYPKHSGTALACCPAGVRDFSISRSAVQ
jgi:hypothetical protein